MRRRNIKDGTEVVPGYSRAVRVGPHVHVSGTTSADGDGKVIGADLYAQTRETYAKIGSALEGAGASFADVVRFVAYCTDISKAEEFARATAEVLGGIDPAGTLVEVQALMTPEMQIEIEVYAIVDEG